MTNETKELPNLEELEAIEHGARRPEGLAKQILLATAIIWALFQLWVASPIPFILAFGVFNDTEIRSIHLGFAIFLVYLSFPARSHKRVHKIPVHDWIQAIVATYCALYLYTHYEALADRAGDPTAWDVGVAFVGVLMLLEATRRALGWPLTIIASLFLFYTFAGPILPDVMAHKGASIGRVASHQWLTTEGVFGVAVGVSAGFVFLFVLFGSMLEQAGGGHYFIRVAFSMVGHLKGGPAKAGVLASGLTGMISGSSIANVVTTGTFTIPMMKKAGFTGPKAGAIEVAASTNGQIMPPVMGAAAFLMVEYLNISYMEVIKHAFLPAVLSYIALMYVVHLEAVKAGMQGRPRPDMGPMSKRVIGFGLTISGTVILFGLAYLIVSGVNQLFGDLAFWANGALVLGVYIGLIAWEAHSPLPQEMSLDHLPKPSQALRGGLHYLLPILVLVWCLMLLRLSPATAVFYSIVLMMIILLTQHPLRAFFTKQPIGPTLKQGFNDLIVSLENGSRNMIGIGVATAAAGIVVGTVTLTGVGQMLGELIEILSFGSVMLMLILTAMICMILGMGLPTTANYIVVSTLMAPVIVQLATGHGIDMPLVAVHLFVFYFGILADDTPPVGLAAYAAAGISGADPIKTGMQSFYYDIRTAILPFMFIFNTELLLIGVETVWQFLWIFSVSLAAMLMFVAATQNFFLTKNRAWETALLLLVAFSLFRPDYWRDMVSPAYAERPASQLEHVVAELKPDDPLRLKIEVEDENGLIQIRTLSFKVPNVEPDTRLETLGFITEPAGDSLKVVDIGFMSTAESVGLEPGFTQRILGFEERRDQPSKFWFVLPPLMLFGLIVFTQRRRCHLLKN